MKFFSRLFATSVIEICGGSATCSKGKLPNRLLQDLSELAEESAMEAGEIWIGQLGKVDFSHEIPEALHQRIRNVLCCHLP